MYSVDNKFVDVHTALVSHLKSEPAQCQTLSPYPSSSSASSVSLLRVNWDRAEVLMNIFLQKHWLITSRIASGSVASLHLGSHSLASCVAKLTIRSFTKQPVNRCINGWVLTPVKLQSHVAWANFHSPISVNEK